MSRAVLVLLFGIFVSAVKPGHADEPSQPATLPPAIPVPCAEPCVPPIVEKCLRTREFYLLEKQAACTLPDFKLRDVEACRDKRVNLEIKYNETRQTCTELEIKARETEQEVCCTEVKPVTTIDPCTGCPCTVYQPFPVTKKVKITVYEAVPVTKEYIVRTPCLNPVEEDVIVKKLAIDFMSIPAIEKRLTVLTTDCEMKYPVPVPPPAPCCPVKGCGSCR